MGESGVFGDEDACLPREVCEDNASGAISHDDGKVAAPFVVTPLEPLGLSWGEGWGEAAYGKFLQVLVFAPEIPAGAGIVSIGDAGCEVIVNLPDVDVWREEFVDLLSDLRFAHSPE
jgi:hypothetical protein